MWLDNFGAFFQLWWFCVLVFCENILWLLWAKLSQILTQHHFSLGDVEMLNYLINSAAHSKLIFNFCCFCIHWTKCFYSQFQAHSYLWSFLGFSWVPCWLCCWWPPLWSLCSTKPTTKSNMCFSPPASPPWASRWALTSHSFLCTDFF